MCGIRFLCELSNGTSRARITPDTKLHVAGYTVGPIKVLYELAIERIVSMKIAQIAPLWESVPPRLYGGTERVVSYITEELVRQGHEVTLFASGDSSTTADLRAACPHALRLNTGLVNRDAPLILMQEQAFGAEADQFDIIHSHLDFLSFPMSRRCATPVLTTLHGRLDLPELVPIFREYAEMPVVSISDSQRTPLPNANWMGTVYHGLPDLYD